MENCFRNVKKIWENVYDIIISPIYYITDITPLYNAFTSYVFTIIL